MKYLVVPSVLFLLSGPVVAGGEHKHHHDAGHDQKHGHDKGHGHDHGKHGVSKVGAPAPADKASKTINVAMSDNMRFAFDQPLEIRHGEIVRFVVSNQGKIRHEFSISNAEEQKAHVAMMKEMPDMKHEDGNTITVEPGEQLALTWQFSGEREVVLACNIPGHSEAGMIVHYTLQE